MASLKPTLSVLGYCRFFSLPFEKRASGRKHMWPPPHLSKRLQVREGFRSVGPSFVRSFVRSFIIVVAVVVVIIIIIIIIVIIIIIIIIIFMAGTS